MTFEQNNLNQDLVSDSNIHNHISNSKFHDFENDLMNTPSDNVFPDDSMYSSFYEIYNEFNDLIQSNSEDTRNSINSKGSYSSTSDNSCIHGEKVKKMKRRKTNIGTKEHWNANEDRLLVALVEKFGNGRWNFLAQKMPLGRKGKQLRERFNNHLRPGLKKEAWSEEEDLKLIQAHENLGNKWVEIAKIIPGRSESDIKNRWNATKRRCLTAIKKSNIPKPNSLFENYVKSFVRNKTLKSPISVESNAIFESEGNVEIHKNSLVNGSNELSTAFDPNKLSAVNNGHALFGGSTGLRPSSDQNELFENDNGSDWGSFMEYLYLLDDG